MVSFTSFGTTVTLRNPQKGNTEELDLQISRKRTISGALFTWTKTPAKLKLGLSWVYIPSADRNKMIALLKQAAGNTFKYVDHRGSAKFVRLLNPTFSFTNDRRNANSFSIDLEVVANA